MPSRMTGSALRRSSPRFTARSWMACTSSQLRFNRSATASWLAARSQSIASSSNKAVTRLPGSAHEKPRWAFFSDAPMEDFRLGHGGFGGMLFHDFPNFLHDPRVFDIFVTGPDLVNSQSTGHVRAPGLRPSNGFSAAAQQRRTA